MNVKKVVVIASASAVMLAAAFGLAVKLKPNYEIEFAAGREEYTVNGRVKAFDEKTERLPYIDEDTEKLQLPLRYVIEELGGTLEWDERDEATVIKCNSVNVRIQADSKRAALNGYAIDLRDAPVLIKGTMYVTADMFTDYFGTVISWDDAKKQITLKTETIPRPIVAVKDLSHELDIAEYSVEVPIITGLDDKKYEKNLNLSLATHGSDEVQDFIAEAKKTYKEEDTQFYRYTTCTTTYRSQEFISILSQGQTMTGKGTKPLKSSFNIDLQGQKFVHLKDLFKDENYEKKLSAHLNIDETMFDSETEDNFYINEKHQFVLFFENQTGGYTEYAVNFAEIKRLLKPKYQYLAETNRVEAH